MIFFPLVCQPVLHSPGAASAATDGAVVRLVLGRDSLGRSLAHSRKPFSQVSVVRVTTG
jgi:hypothetical protein